MVNNIDNKEIALISEDELFLGSEEFKLETHKCTVSFPSYFIKIYLVTNPEFEKLIRAINMMPPRNWDGVFIPEGLGEYSVDCISWVNTKMYAQYIGRYLLTEKEWGKSVSGVLIAVDDYRGMNSIKVISHIFDCGEIFITFLISAPPKYSVINNLAGCNFQCVNKQNFFVLDKSCK